MPTAAGCARRQCTIGVVPVSSRVRRNKQVTSTEMPTSEKGWRITLLEDCFSSSARCGNLAIGCKAPVYLVAARRGGAITERVYLQQEYAEEGRRSAHPARASNAGTHCWQCIGRAGTHCPPPRARLVPVQSQKQLAPATQSQKHRSFEAGNLTTSESLSSDRSYRSSGHAELDINHLTIAPIISSTRSLS